MISAVFIKRSDSRRVGFAWRTLLLTALAWVAGCAVAVRGQDNLLPPQPAPPPIKYIPDAARDQLFAARDPKTRVRVSLEQAEQYLQSTEQQTAQQHYDAATAALGVYQALMDDALHFLQQSGKTDGKTRDLYKRLEQALYRDGARIESLRRVTPTDYAGILKDTIRYVQDARSDALNAFYGNTVLRENANDKMKTPGSAPSTPTLAPSRKDQSKPIPPPSNLKR